jgi:trk system potassium uptake protein TrkH
MVLVTLMFLFTPLDMCYPMMSSALSTKATLVGAPATFLFARTWMQWYGGLGSVVLSLALVMPPGIID